MWLIFVLAVSLVILNALSLAPGASESIQAVSEINKFDAYDQMPFLQPPKPPNLSIRRINNLFDTEQTLRNETLRPLMRSEEKANHFNSRKLKEKTFSPVRHYSHGVPDIYTKRTISSDRLLTTTQISRPPRLTSTLSENRRRYLESVLEQPRPFNFPLEEPRPSEFKKTHQSRKENIHNNAQRVNNIQDILRQEHVAKHYRMPIGIHISGSFKNLQRSGISNFLQKYAHIQHQMVPSQLNFQRINFDPFYHYKPKSLSDINSLAVKQFGLKQPKKKSKANIIPSLIFQQSANRPAAAADYYFDAIKMNSSLNHIGSQRFLKNEPFSLKLEVYPIRSGKKGPAIPMIGSQLTTTTRPNIHNFESQVPYQIPYALPVDSSINNLNYVNNAQFLKTKVVQPTSHQHSKYPMNLNVLTALAEEKKRNEERIGNTPKHTTNQLMVHLNVFPKKKESNIAQNHLYDIITADVHERRFNKIEAIKNNQSETTFIDCDTADKINENDAQFSEKSESQQDDMKSIGDAQPLQLDLNETSKFSRNGLDNITEKTSTFRFPIENLLKFQPNDAVI